MFKKLFKRKIKQHSQYFGPKCRNELVSSDSFAENKDNLVPMLRTYGDCYFFIHEVLGGMHCKKKGGLNNETS